MKILFVAVLLCFSQCPFVIGETCDVESSPRQDCGYYGITLEECIIVRKCCWDPKENEPWCFSGTPNEGSVEVCTPEHGVPRIDCGYLGIDQTICEERGCCWSPADDPETPWCFKTTIKPEEPTPPPTGSVCAPDKPRNDCGFFGITQQQCEDSGCCWTPSFDLPWCYNATALLTDENCIAASDNRADCGFIGISEKECEEKSCCWDPEYNQPWCFKPAVMTPAPEPEPAAHIVNQEEEPAPEVVPPEKPSEEPVIAPLEKCFPDKPRVDCGYYGITQEECEKDGCCWTPDFENGLPWCYKLTPLMTDEFCIAASNDRTDCGYYGIGQEECEEKSCCWNPEYNQPWCFNPAVVTIAPEPEPAAHIVNEEEPAPEVVPPEKPSEEPVIAPLEKCFPDKPRVDCGYYGITQEECEKDGCCWTPDFENGLPWCYKLTPLMTDEFCIAASNDRTDCGYYGIGQEECEEKSCCWNPEYNQPWCFNPAVVTIAPEPEPAAHIVNEEEPAPEVVPPEKPSEEPVIAPLEKCFPDKPRFDCGYYGINQEECESSGCCWTPDYELGLPWCYKETPLMTDESCIAGSKDRTDCGYIGITQQECEEEDCCWNPEYGQPWCFKKGTVTIEPPPAEEPKPEVASPAPAEVPVAPVEPEAPIDAELQEILEELIEAVKERVEG